MSVTYCVMNDTGNLEPTRPINQLSSHRLRNANIKSDFTALADARPRDLVEEDLG